MNKWTDNLWSLGLKDNTGRASVVLVVCQTFAGLQPTAVTTVTRDINVTH